MKLSGEKICKRFKQAKAKKTLWMETYEDAMEYAAPQRENFDASFAGSKKDGAQRVFDSTAQNALFKFSSNLQSSLVPPMKRWVGLEPGFGIADTDANRATLESVNTIMFDSLAVSNFDTQISECFMDLAIGTACLLVRQGTVSEPFKFVAVPIRDIYVDEGEDGRVGYVYRYFCSELETVELTWPDAKIPEEIKEEYNTDGKPKELKLIECSYFDQKDGIYRYNVVIEKGQHIIVERESRTNPMIAFRWAVLPGETYGRGPVLTALPDIKTINKTKELLLQSASMAIFGMFTLDTNSGLNVENIQFGPAAIIEGAEGLSGPALKPIDSPGRPDLAQIIIQDLARSINEMLFADPLGPVDLPVKTATEISLRQQDLAKRIGSAFGRLQFEFIIPLVLRMLEILDNLELIDLGNLITATAIRVKPVSPLSMAQDEEDVVRHMRFAETVVGLFGPEAGMALLDVPEFVELLADKMNINPKTKADKEAIKELVSGLMNAASQQAI